MSELRSNRFIVVAASVALTFSACGDDGADTEAAEPIAAVATTADSPSDSRPPATAPGVSVPANGDVVEVLALDNNFRPEELEVVAGTTVRWDNGGRNDHNIIPVDDTQDWGADVADFEPGEVYEHVFTTPGEYPYYCTLHGTATAGMIGTVVVTG